MVQLDEGVSGLIQPSGAHVGLVRSWKIDGGIAELWESIVAPAVLDAYSSIEVRLASVPEDGAVLGLKRRSDLVSGSADDPPEWFAYLEAIEMPVPAAMAATRKGVTRRLAIKGVADAGLVFRESSGSFRVDDFLLRGNFKAPEDPGDWLRIIALPGSPPPPTDAATFLALAKSGPGVVSRIRVHYTWTKYAPKP